MKLLLFKKAYSLNHLLKTKYFLNSIRTLQLNKIVSSRNQASLNLSTTILYEKNIHSALSNGLNEKLNIIFKKVESFFENIYNNSFYLFFKTTPINQQNSNTNHNNQNENNPPPPDPKKALVSLMISVATFYLIYYIIKDIERFSQKTNGQSVQSNQNAVNQSDNNLNINISQKSDTLGNVINWNELETQLLPNKLISRIIISTSSPIAIIYLKNPVVVNGHKFAFFIYQYKEREKFEMKLAKAQEDLHYNDDEKIFCEYMDGAFFQNIIKLVTFIILGIFLYKIGGKIVNKLISFQTEMFTGFSKAKYTVVDPHLKTGVPKVTFKDVAGLHEAKIEVKEFVDYLSKPEKYKALGARVPKGALLLGPPGCGKTMLAKAVAAEANVPFFNMNGTEFIEMIGGVGASRVRSLFEEAKKQSPSIIYIDEIDAVGKKRSGSEQQGGSGESDQTLNQLLVSMDGLESNSNVIVLASTNRADTLDKALLRPGRLDRHISIDLPTFLERKEILAVHLRNLVCDFDKKNDEFISQLCHLTPRFSGADLANICNEAALRAAREAHKSVTKKDFIAALERVLAGPEKRSSTVSIEDRKLIAYRECGHIIISWFHQYSDLILKVSLLSRTKMNAFSQYLPSDKKLFSKEELFDQMCLYFGGRVAESVVFNRFTTQSEQDLKKITNLAYAQVESFGMNDVIGNMSFPTQREEKAGSGGVGKRPYSKKLRSIIDQEVNKLVAQSHKSAEQTLKNHIDKLHLLSEELIKRESLNYEEIVELIGQPLNKSRFTLAQLNSKTSSDI